MEVVLAICQRLRTSLLIGTRPEKEIGPLVAARHHGQPLAQMALFAAPLAPRALGLRAPRSFVVSSLGSSLGPGAFGG